MGANMWTFSYLPDKCPCYQCTDRCVGCHGKCAKFKQWEQEKPKAKKVGYFKEGYYK